MIRSIYYIAFFLFWGFCCAAQSSSKTTEPPCPDFSNSKSKKYKPKELYGKNTPIDLEVHVFSAQDQNPLVKAMIEIQDPRYGKKRVYTNTKGIATQESLPTGPYLLICTKSGYKPESREIMLRSNYAPIQFNLMPLSEEEKPTFPVFTVPENPKKEVVLVEEKKDTLVETENSGELSKALYKPNNVVFLIDISSSMGMRQRLPLLKKAMLELLGLLRDIDRVSIVTYASKTSILLPSTPTSEKTKIKACIDSLQAEGLTAGEKGIELAYQVAQERFLPDGNNEVFIATDGAFNVGGDQASILPYIKKQAQKKIYLSVLGIKHAAIIEEDLKNLAKNGKGEFVPIASEDQAKALVETIKAHSVIK